MHVPQIFLTQSTLTATLFHAHDDQRGGPRLHLCPATSETEAVSAISNPVYHDHGPGHICTNTCSEDVTVPSLQFSAKKKAKHKVSYNTITLHFQQNETEKRTHPLGVAARLSVVEAFELGTHRRPRGKQIRTIVRLGVKF